MTLDMLKNGETAVIKTVGGAYSAYGRHSSKDRAHGRPDRNKGQGI